MKTTPTVLCVAVVALAGCGGDEPSASRSGADAAARKKAKTMAKRDPSGQADPAKRGAASAGAGTTIVLGESRFGRMLFDSKKQAI